MEEERLKLFHLPAEGQRMGHAGAIISGDFGTTQSKIKTLKGARALIADTPWNVPILIEENL